jgi:hypothetical protein
MTNFKSKVEKNPRKLEISEEIVSYTIVSMMTKFHTKEFVAKEQ